jgi:hypothetical protein
MKDTLGTIADLHPDRDPSSLDAIVKDAEKKLNVQKLLREVNLRFGVNCWHINEDESAAMWRLYGVAGGGVAIQSTKARLEAALTADGIIMDQVRYMDFERDEIEKGHKHYGLFIKRNSFSHEREFRAAKLLPVPGRGTYIKCDMNILIENIYISPQAPAYFVESVKFIIKHAKLELADNIRVSRLLDKPE